MAAVPWQARVLKARALLLCKMSIHGLRDEADTLTVGYSTRDKCWETVRHCKTVRRQPTLTLGQTTSCNCDSKLFAHVMIICLQYDCPHRHVTVTSHQQPTSGQVDDVCWWTTGVDERVLWCKCSVHTLLDGLGVFELATHIYTYPVYLGPPGVPPHTPISVQHPQ